MLPGTMGGYRVIGVLGHGGMGVVYRGEHLETGAPVALKTVRAPSRVQLESIRREILALGRLQHPGIVRILSTGVSGGVPWYAMELLQGETLRERLGRLWRQAPGKAPTATAGADRTAPLDELASPSAAAVLPGVAPADRKPLLALIRRLAGTLACLHGNGLVHRDLKPANVFIQPDGTPVLVDFGIAASFGGGAESREELAAGERTVGSHPYMAPEHIRGELVDARADLYSLGCILYECVTGRPPFTGQWGGSVLFQHLNEHPLPPSCRVTGVPEELDRLILRLLEKRPQDRLGYAEDVARALGALGEEEKPGEPRAAAYLYRPPLEGRRDVLSRLEDALERARGGQGGLVLLGGESGIGKTRLAVELLGHAAKKGFTVVAGQCVALGAALHPFRPLLVAMADLGRELGASEADRLLGARGKLLAAYEPALAELPGLERHPEPPELPPDAARARVLGALEQSLLAFAKTSPLLLVLDDLQWADELSLGFLKKLAAGALAEHRVLVLGAYRIEEGAGELAELVRAEGVTSIALGRLDEAGIGAMVSGMLALREPPADLVAFVNERSDGNPFFVAEYLRAAIAEGLLGRDDAGRWRLKERAEEAGALANSVPLPRSLAALIDRRLAGLGEERLSLLQWASVLGREMEGEVLSAATGLDEAAFLEALETLRVQQVLEESAPGRLRFVHDKLREVAYQRIPGERRAALHREAALALEARYPDAPDVCSDLAHHFAQAGIHDKAAGYFGRAADRARLTYANGEAIAQYRAAVAHAQEVLRADAGAAGAWAGRLGAFHEGLGDVLALTGRQEEARTALGEALEHAPAQDRIGRARLWRKVGKAWETPHAYDEALAAHARANEALGQEPCAPIEEWWHEWIQVRIEQLSVHYWLAHVLQMRALVEEVRPALEAHGSDMQRARFPALMVQIGVRLERYRTSEETVGYARAALRASESAGDAAEVLAARFNLACTLLWHGAFDEAAQQMLAMIEEARRMGDVTMQALGLAYLGQIHRRRGEVEQTRRCARECLTLAEAGNMVAYAAAARANLAWVAFREGRAPEAEQEARAAVASWKSVSIVYPFHWMALMPLAALALARGAVAEAVEHARGMLEPSQQRLPDDLSAALEHAVGVQAEHARPTLERALQLARQEGYL